MESQYKKISSLGEGNFGLALLCDRLDGVRIVLKKISYRDNQKAKENAKNEARILSMLNHPNVIRSIDYFRSANSIYIEMEYMEGGSLAAQISQRRDEPFENADILLYLKQIAAALRYIHCEISVVHRDVKPDNLLLSVDRRVVKLADFGIAVVLADGQMLNEKTGTGSYMAPEILNAQDYDFSVDVWSFGCVAYELVERRRCFEGAAQFRIVTGKIRLPTYSVFRDVIGRLLTRYVRERPTATEAITLLDELNLDANQKVGTSSRGRA